MSAYPKTTWEDLSSLGWPINNVYNAANAARDGTMNGIDDLSLNSGIAAKYQWWSYNATIGTPYLMSSRPQTATKEEVAWSYDNTQNDRPFEQPWTERWTETTSADVSISTSATVSLNASVTIFDVASTGFDISISVDSSSSQHKERSHELSTSWTMEVGPHEKLTLIRTITTSTTVAEYGQDFGLRDDSMVGTEGDKWNGHYYWGMNINWLCNSPKGTMHILGVGRSVEYSFKLVREGPKGRTTKPLPVKSKAVKELAAQPEVALLVPGGEATA
ncbi:hypothetical protein BN946_scf184907.g18 [Trametes cinnabarina]|uniref:Cytolysin n=1 Tax=Pycnoporus cinnabarinus TaxID=5643 RepID=A0A060SZN4_PYCCI|nr:hypothetical protein BN946_scf184907.g18 [Trametes cinnabarina]